MDLTPPPEPAATTPDGVGDDATTAPPAVPPPTPVPPPPPECRAGWFYVIDSSRMSVPEHWWITRSPAFLLTLAHKAVRARLPISADSANTESLRPFEVAAADLPPDVRARFDPAVAELSALGFHSPVFHSLWDPF